MVIAAATVAQAYIYWHQKRLMNEALTETSRAANAAEDSAKTSRESLEISQRAMVMLDSIQLRNDAPQSPGRPSIEHFVRSYIEVLIKNVGPTEAEDFYLTMRPFIIGVNAPTTVESIVSHRTVMQRGKSVREIIPEIGRLFRRGEIASALEGNATLEVKGFIRYRDVFAKGWYVWFESAMDQASYQFRTTMQIWQDGNQPPDLDADLR